MSCKDQTTHLTLGAGESGRLGGAHGGQPIVCAQRGPTADKVSGALTLYQVSQGSWFVCCYTNTTVLSVVVSSVCQTSHAREGKNPATVVRSLSLIQIPHNKNQ